MSAARRADAEASSCPPLRRDAQRNRESLLAAAQAHFAANGLDAPLDQIAKDAGLAIGTLYRHFPNRLGLIKALFADKLQSWLDAAERAAALDDAWTGFVVFIEAMCQLQADDQGFNDLVSMRLPEAAGLAATQDRIGDIAARIIRRAQEQGSLRPDLTTEDLAFVIWSQSGINQATRDVAPRAWRRHLYLMLDGFRAEHAHPLPEPPMTSEQTYQAMLGLNGTRTSQLTPAPYSQEASPRQPKRADDLRASTPTVSGSASGTAPGRPASGCAA